MEQRFEPTDTPRERASSVHTHVSTNPGAGEQDAADRARDKANEVKDEAKAKAQQATDQARGKMDEAKQRAGEMADEARTKAEDTLHRAESTLEERTHLVSRAQDNPVAALGIAFGVGFLLAGGGDEEEEEDGRKRRAGQRPRRKRKSALSGAKRQLTGAVMGSLSAALTQQVKEMVQRGDLPGTLGDIANQFLGTQGGGKRGRTGASEGSSGMQTGTRSAPRSSSIITEANDSMIGSRPV